VVASCTKLVSPVGAPPHKRGADDKYHMENGVGGGAVGVVLDLCLYNKFLRVLDCSVPASHSSAAKAVKRCQSGKRSCLKTGNRGGDHIAVSWRAVHDITVF